MKRASLIGILLLFASSPVWADFDEAVRAYESGDHATSLHEFQILAEHGDANAQYNLGVMYETGQGVLQDYAEAVKWYRLAAEQGDGLAQTNLGVMYGNGRGVTQNYVLARIWNNLAAAKLPPGEDKDIAVSNRDIVESKMTPE